MATVAQPDPDVKLPRAVRAQAQRAAELSKEQHIENAPPPQEEPKPPQNGAETPQELPGQVSPPSEQPPQPPPQAPPQPLQPQASDWEQRYRSMEGRFQSLNRQLSQLGEDNGNLRRLLAMAQAQAPQPREQQTAAQRLISEQEMNDYGPDFMEVVGRRAKEIVMNDVMPEVENLKRQVNVTTETAQQNARMSVYQTLDQRVANWRQINEADEFHQWLAGYDPYSGQVRKVMLNHAFEANDAARVAAFFEGFVNELSAVAPRENSELSPPGKKVSLASLAAPGRSRAAEPPSSASSDKSIITTAQISRFYTDVAAGKYPKAEADRLEKMIFEAQSEGRIKQV